MNTNSPTPLWTEDDTEAMFAAIGRYVFIFQYIEAKLDQILLLAYGHENRTKRQQKIAKMNFDDRIKEVTRIVLTSPDFDRVHARPGWVQSFQALMSAVDRERIRRNELLHSQYIMEFTEAGLPPVRSRLIKNSPQPVELEDFTAEAQKRLVAEIGALSVRVNFLVTQLNHDYKAPPPHDWAGGPVEWTIDWDPGDDPSDESP